MSEPMLECVPNFSEGTREDVVKQITGAIEAVDGAKLIGSEMDADHNRAVVTMVGPRPAVIEAAVRSCREAVRLIDLNKHEGAHPRAGAMDVCPFIPMGDATMQDAVDAAEECGRRIGDELEVPVFLYGEAARREGRETAGKARKGQFEGLKDKIGEDPEKEPDYGPQRIHPTAGVTCVGARFFLIAYNVNLDTDDVQVAKDIAKEVRTSSGGFPCVQGAGFMLEDRGIPQVSMNLTDYRKTGIYFIFDEISKRAEERGVQVIGSEIVGLVPRAALEGDDPARLKLEGWSDDQVIENHL